jgi:hypothetical protein
MVSWLPVTMHRVKLSFPERSMAAFTSLDPNAMDFWLDG